MEKKTLYWSRAPGKFVNKYTGEEPFRNKTEKQTVLKQIKEYTLDNMIPKPLSRFFKKQRKKKFLLVQDQCLQGLLENGMRHL